MILARRPGRAGECVGKESALPLSYGRITGRHPTTSIVPRTAWNARRDLNPRPPSPVKLPPSARAGRAGNRTKRFARCSSGLSYGHSSALLPAKGWPTGVEPVPSDSQSDALAVELRPPRCRSIDEPAGTPAPLARGVACHTRGDDRAPRRPCFLPSCATLGHGSPRAGGKRIAPPGKLRGRGDFGRSRMTVMRSVPIQAHATTLRAGCLRPAGPAPQCRRDGSPFRSRRMRVPGDCPCPSSTPRTRGPAAPGRTPAAYRAAPVRRPAGQSCGGGRGTASSWVRSFVDLWLRRHNPPVGKNKKGAASGCRRSTVLVVRGRPVAPR